jgi:hyperosmotically inducible protein
MHNRTWRVFGFDLGGVAGAAVLASGLVLGAGAARAQGSAASPTTEQQIQNNLRGDSDLADDQLEVRVSGDTVVLKGVVDSEGEKEKAVRHAQVKGIAVIDNQLKVQSAGVKQTVSDSAITAQVKTQFLANTTLRKTGIDVDTNGAVVTLKGTVPSEDARRLAVDVARNTGGVKRVEDRLQIAPAR